MSTLGQRVDAAIRASGKTGEHIAQTLGVDANTISRIRTGREDNPKIQLLIGIARETGRKVAALLGESFDISPDDEQELERFRGWIDSKLATRDAMEEPNAEIISDPATAMRDRRIADRPRIEMPFGSDANLVLRAIGESMTGHGILPDDTLWATPAEPAGAAAADGRIIVCRVGEGVFVKRLVTEHGRRILLSAHPRYQPIVVDERGAFALLGIVIGRSGRVS